MKGELLDVELFVQFVVYRAVALHRLFPAVTSPKTWLECYLEERINLPPIHTYLPSVQARNAAFIHNPQAVTPRLVHFKHPFPHPPTFARSQEITASQTYPHPSRRHPRSLLPPHSQHAATVAATARSPWTWRALVSRDAPLGAFPRPRFASTARRRRGSRTGAW